MKYVLISVIVSILGFSCSDDATSDTNASDSTQANTPLEFNEVMGIAVIEPTNRIIAISSKASGVISRVYVNIGDSVSKGDLLLQIESEIEKVQLKQNIAQLKTQEKGVVVSKASLEVVQSQLDQANRELVRAEKLYAGNAVTLEQLEKARSAANILKKQLAAQEVSISQQESSLKELSTAIQLIQARKSQKEVRAPRNGVVLSFNVREGEYLSPGVSVAEFAPEGPVMALTEIDELFADKVQVGQSAEIRLQGSDKVLSEGIVTQTSPYLRKKSLFSDNSTNLEDRRVREVRVQLADPSQVLLGARVECWIDTK